MRFLISGVVRQARKLREEIKTFQITLNAVAKDFDPVPTQKVGLSDDSTGTISRKSRAKLAAAEKARRAKRGFGPKGNRASRERAKMARKERWARKKKDAADNKKIRKATPL